MRTTLGFQFHEATSAVFWIGATRSVKLTFLLAGLLQRTLQTEASGRHECWCWSADTALKNWQAFSIGQESHILVETVRKAT